jgi:hypothetical protein
LIAHLRKVVEHAEFAQVIQKKKERNDLRCNGASYYYSYRLSSKSIHNGGTYFFKYQYLIGTTIEAKLK